jgi:DNA-binding transcriptional ArsR family regulator
MEDKFIKLTNTVYRVLEFFPESEPLKNKVKDKALSIMETLMEAVPRDEASIALLGRDIDILLSCFKIAEKQGWMSNINYLIISYQYENIKKEIGLVKEMTQELSNKDTLLIKEKPELTPFSFSERQGKILEFLKQKEKAQVMDLQMVLTNVTKRTIRRDLDELLTEGKIIRSGEFSQIFYKMNQ